ncbi:MAG: hypothetical protein GEU82_14170 [Luteitalea sp.]|nr:hypothetical protein [Luteitalea sp.]
MELRSPRTFIMAAAAAGLGLLTAGAATALPAAGDAGPLGCTNADLRGTFGFTAQGVTLPGSPVPPPLQGAFASSGLSTFDGRGHFTLTATNSFNGFVQGPGVVTGTYEVNGDCTYTSQSDSGVTFRAAIVSGGDELLILQTTPGVVVSGVARRQGRRRDRSPDLESPPRRCDASAIRGTYGFLANGVAGPLHGVGTVAFDRGGGFTLTATRSVNGTLDPEPLTLIGTYAFTEGCAFRMSFDVGFNFTATIVGEGREIVFIQTDPGTTLIVRATRQST